MPVVSLLMPVHNQADGVGPTVLSMGAQTFPDWELIVVDDGSTDHLAAVLAQFLDPRLRLFSQPHAGRARALNRGLAQARGDYIGWCLPGDILLPACLAALHAALASQPRYGAVYADYQLVDAAANPLTAAGVGPAGSGGAFAWGPAFLLRREVVDAVGPFREGQAGDCLADYHQRVRGAARLCRLPRVLYLHQGR